MNRKKKLKATGILPLRTEIQHESMDTQLKHRLWNVFKEKIANPMLEYADTYISSDQYNPVYNFFRNIWDKLLKVSLENLPPRIDMGIEMLNKIFYRFEWIDVFKFLEFIINLDQNSIPHYVDMEDFVNTCNNVLTEELSAYRLIGGKVIDITDEKEIEEIASAVKGANKFKLEGVRIHLEAATEKLAIKRNPDYRNSIKESISAVESLCQKIIGKSNVSLGDALNEIEREGKVKIHSALKQAYSKIYGYTSDADGIRHGMSDKSNCDFADAKYMLVSCSAFINYLIEKASNAGVKF